MLRLHSCRTTNSNKRRGCPLEQSLSMTSPRILSLFLAVVISVGCLPFATSSNAVTIDTALYADLGITIHKDSNGGKIIDGQVAPVGKYPTFVTTENPNILCGGVLIWPDIVMSAAHCLEVFDSIRATARIGGTILNITGSNALEKIRIKNVFQYPAYDDDVVGRNDIMLILLNQTSNVTVSPYNTNPALPVDGQDAVVVGHGRTGDGTRSNVLKEATVTTISFQTCVEAYAGYEGLFCSNETFCAIKNTGVHCFGDSGGPLFDPNTGAVIGIVSFAATSACDEGPNGYARVSTFAPWIRDIICSYSAVKTSGCSPPPPPIMAPIAPSAPIAPTTPSAPIAPMTSPTATNTTSLSSSSLMTTMMMLRSKDSSTSSSTTTSSAPEAATAGDGVCTLLSDVPPTDDGDDFFNTLSCGRDSAGSVCDEMKLNYMHQRLFFFFCREDCIDESVVNRKFFFGWRCGPC